MNIKNWIHRQCLNQIYLFILVATLFLAKNSAISQNMNSEYPDKKSDQAILPYNKQETPIILQQKHKHKHIVRGRVLGTQNSNLKRKPPNLLLGKESSKQIYNTLPRIQPNPKGSHKTSAQYVNDLEKIRYPTDGSKKNNNRQLQPKVASSRPASSAELQLTTTKNARNRTLNKRSEISRDININKESDYEIYLEEILVPGNAQVHIASRPRIRD